MKSLHRMDQLVLGDHMHKATESAKKQLPLGRVQVGVPRLLGGSDNGGRCGPCLAGSQCAKRLSPASDSGTVTVNVACAFAYESWRATDAGKKCTRYFELCPKPFEDLEDTQIRMRPIDLTPDDGNPDGQHAAIDVLGVT